MLRTIPESLGPVSWYRHLSTHDSAQGKSCTLIGRVGFELSSSGRRRLGTNVEDGAGKRDLRRFWESLECAGMIGTIDAPVSSAVENPVGVARAEVLRLLGR